jgi:hypothetical protein
MQVRLKVVQGKPLGKQIILPVDRFVIGRAAECHLRPNSDLVDSQQCAIVSEGGEVRVEHLGRANGTHVNGMSVEGAVPVKTGDLLQVGPLVFAFDLVPLPREPKSANGTAEGPQAASALRTAPSPATEPVANSESPTEPETPDLIMEALSESSAAELVAALPDGQGGVAPAVAAPSLSASITPEPEGPVLEMAPEWESSADASEGDPSLEEPAAQTNVDAAANVQAATTNKELVTGADVGGDGDVMDWLMDGPEPASTGMSVGSTSANGSPSLDPTQSGEATPPNESKKNASYEKTSTAAADILRKWMQGGGQK